LPDGTNALVGVVVWLAEVVALVDVGDVSVGRPLGEGVPSTPSPGCPPCRVYGLAAQVVRRLRLLGRESAGGE